MKYDEVFSVGFDRSYGGTDFYIKGKYCLGSLTREEFNQLVQVTYYALSQLEHMLKDDEKMCRGETNDTKN